jgi:hypothetical protein
MVQKLFNSVERFLVHSPPKEVFSMADPAVTPQNVAINLPVDGVLNLKFVPRTAAGAIQNCTGFTSDGNFTMFASANSSLGINNISIPPSAGDATGLTVQLTNAQIKTLMIDMQRYGLGSRVNYEYYAQNGTGDILRAAQGQMSITSFNQV